MSIYDGYEGIAEDRHGIRAYVKVRKRQTEKRFKRGTPIKTILDWLDVTRGALKSGSVPTPKDTLIADATRYLVHMKATIAKTSYRSLVCEINAWIPDLGHIQRHKITREQVLNIRNRWLSVPRGGKGKDHDKPIAPKTCNHRVRALRGLYHYIDGSKAPTPCDDVPKLQEPPAAPRFVSAAVVKRIAANIEDPKTQARFMVLASTGQRPAQLKRALPADVDLRRRVWFVRPAKGGHAIPVILTDDMVIAFKALKAAKAFGDFDGSDYAKDLYAAGWDKKKFGRPYNAKHTVAITLGESGAEWEDIKDWFGHTDIKTTRIYTGHILARTKRTSRRLEGRIGWKLPA